MDPKESTRADFHSKAAEYLRRGFHRSSIEEKLDESNNLFSDELKLPYGEIAEIVTAEGELFSATREIENARALAQDPDSTLKRELWGVSEEKKRVLIEKGALSPEESEDFEEFTDETPSEWVDEPRPEVFHGVLGEICRTIGPMTEADPMGILITGLVGLGNLFGAMPFVRIGQVKHPARLSAVIVGASSKARKGTATTEMQAVLDMIEPQEDTCWSRRCVVRGGGMTSGEGLIEALRDGHFVPKKGQKEPEYVEGVADKRLFLVETEFGRVLSVMTREGSILGAILCQAWETAGTLTSLSRRQLSATGAHISILGHITITELKEKLSVGDIHNGFGNRILWCLVRRQRLLPEGSNTHLIDWDGMGVLQKLRHALSLSRRTSEVSLSPDAMAYWREAYPRLSIEQPGVSGELCHRFETQALRIGLIYCLLDARARIEPEHLQAAYELLLYCRRSVQKIWGDRTGSHTADAMIVEIKKVGPEGVKRSMLRALCANGRKKLEVDRALNLIRGLEHFYCEVKKTDGRSSEIWSYDPKRKV